MTSYFGGSAADAQIVHEYTLCLKPCSSEAECRTGYTCGIPWEEPLSLIGGYIASTYCIEGTPSPITDGGSGADGG